MCCVFRYGMILADNGSSCFFQGEAGSPDTWAARVTITDQEAASPDQKLGAFHVRDSACQLL
jgi:hypothetical protein